MALKKIWKKIRQPLIGLAWSIIEDEVADRLEKVEPAELRDFASKTLGLSAEYVAVLTDNDPNNNEQLQALLLEERAQHIEVGVSALTLATLAINNDSARNKAQKAIQIAAALIPKS
jgi:hypothetical protein